MDWKLWNQIADDYEDEDNYAKDFDEIPEWVVDNICPGMNRDIQCDDDVSEISINSDRYVSETESVDEPKVGLDPPDNNDAKSTQFGTPKIEVDVDDTKRICSSNSENSFIKDSSAKTQTLFGDTLNCPLNSRRISQCKVVVENFKQCQPNKKIHETLSKTSNFQIHLKSDHGDLIADELGKNSPSEKVRLFEGTNSTSKQIHSNQDSSLPSTSAASRLTIAATSCQTTSVAVLLNTQIQFNDNVLNYFQTTFTPLDVVESPEFWAMFDHSDVTMPCIGKEHLTTQIENRFNMIENKIITMLEGVDFVCISIDMWSSKCHYYLDYLAITCHWIDAVTLKRRSVALACKNVDSTQDTLKYFKQTLKKYKIPKHKVISIVTKNFQDFSNIFKDLNINTLPKIDTIQEDYSFPFHLLEKEPYICYNNTLSLIVTIDIPKLMDSYHLFRHTNDRVLKKVFSFLFLASSDATLAPMFADLKKPDVAKWNSIYNSIAYFLKLEQKCSFVEMTELLKMEPFTKVEVDDLKQYVNSLRPLALAFERLQSEEGSYHGYILPTLVELRKKCDQLIENKELYRCSDRKKPMTPTQLENLIVFEPFLYLIRSKCLERFNKLLESSPEADLVIIASLSHPFFKDKWVSALGLQKHIVTAKLIGAVKKENSKSNEARVNVEVEDKSEHQIDDFYFGEEGDCKGENISLELEVFRYLRDNRRNLKMLNDYPAVKRVFIKYNTSLSSSEAVEKLFPYKTRQNIATYGALKEDIFEERVLVIVNKDVLDS